jgi:hypothetical protein
MMKMRRALMVPPVLLASGCVDRPWTPSVGVAYWGQSPDAAMLQLPARADALRHWQLSPGDAWSPYAKYTLLTALDVVPEMAQLPDPVRMDEVGRASVAGQQLAANGIPPYTLWIVDLRGAASVAFGVALSRSSPQAVSLVPTFNNWPGDDELVPAEETLAALAMMWPRPPAATDDELSTPVFLLDAWRLAYRFEDPGYETYDNRYILSSGDLPDVDTLRERGIEQVVYVVGSRDTTRVEEDDMNATFLDWQRNGIPIAMLDLERLERPILQNEWPDVLMEDALLVQPRVTLLDQPGFYVLARGGFGGVYAHTSPLTHWGWRGGWHGGGG